MFKELLIMIQRPSRYRPKSKNKQSMHREQHMETRCDCNYVGKEDWNDVKRFEWRSKFAYSAKANGFRINVILLWIKYGIDILEKNISKFCFSPFQP